MEISIETSKKFSPLDAAALNSVVRLLFNAGEKKVVAKITSIMKSGQTTISLNKTIKGETVSICAHPQRVKNILTDWYFVYIGNDKYQFRTQKTRRSLLAVFGQSLKSVRKESGLTQTQLGARLGVTKAYISMVEHGRLSLSLEQIERIARAIGVEATIIIRKAELRTKN